MCRVGQNHIYTVHTRFFWQGNHQIYGQIRCIYTILANPTDVASSVNQGFHALQLVCVPLSGRALCACSRTHTSTHTSTHTQTYTHPHTHIQRTHTHSHTFTHIHTQPFGWRDILVSGGPEEWAKAVRAHRGVLLTDTTM